MFALSALPIVGLTALSKTGVGQKLQVREPSPVSPPLRASLPRPISSERGRSRLPQGDLQRRMGELQGKADSRAGEQAAARANRRVTAAGSAPPAPRKLTFPRPLLPAPQPLLRR